MSSQTRTEQVQEFAAAPGARVLLRRAHWSLVGGALGAALGIANEILCARWLGAGAYGLYALALVVARLAEGVATFGMPVAVLRFLPVSRQREDAGATRGVVFFAVLPPLLAGTLLAAVAWTLAPGVSAAFFDDERAVEYVRGLALAIPFMGLSEVLGYITRGFGFARYYVLVRNVVPPLVFMAAILAMRAHDVAPTGVTAGFALAYAAAALAGAGCVAGLLRAVPRRSAEMPARAMLSYAAPIVATNVLFLMVGGVAVVILSAASGSSAAGVYRACMQVMIPFDLVVLAFDAAVAPAYAVLAATGSRARLEALVGTATRWMSLFAVGYFALVAASSTGLLGLLGDDFARGAPALVLLAAGHLALTCTGVAGFALVMDGRQGLEAANAAAGLATAALLNTLLVPRFGLEGAAFATCAACVLISALRIVEVRSVSGLHVLRSALVPHPPENH